MTEKYVKDEYKYTDEDGRKYALLRGRNYQNQSHWNLNAPALVNLKQFLDQYFQKKP